MTAAPLPDPPPEGAPGLPPLPELPSSVTVPDDASSLARDLAALRREQAAARRVARARRLLLTRRWHSHGVSGPLVALALAIVLVFGAGLALLSPGGTAGALRPRPLANPAVAVGTVGGLLPDVTLRGAGSAAQSFSLRERLRPAAVVLAPRGCDLVTCRDAVVHVTTTARESGLRTWLVGDPADDLIALSREPDRGGGFAVPVLDPGAVVRGAYGATSGLPSLLLVDADGTVRELLRDLSADTSLLTRLQAVR